MNIVKVAKTAGVSIATVSRVINGNSCVKPSTAAQVQNAINTLGYVYRPRAARNGSKIKTKGFTRGLVAVMVFPDSVNETCSPIQTSIIGQIEKYLREEGAAMVHSQITEDIAFHSVFKGEVDGMIAIYWPNRLIKKYEDNLRQIPTIFIGTEYADRWGDHIHNHNETIGILAAKYLLNNECRNLCYIGYKSHSANSERQKGFISAAKADNADIAIFSVSDMNNKEELVSVVDQICSQASFPDGISVFDDNWLSKLYPLFHQRFGQKINQIHLIGCNNEEAYLSGLHPRPATIDINPRSIAEHTVRQLKWRCQNRNDPSQVIVRIEPTLVLSSSEY
jgi:DNA-binding LacI/PurR family transcriptional regulator